MDYASPVTRNQVSVLVVEQSQAKRDHRELVKKRSVMRPKTDEEKHEANLLDAMIRRSTWRMKALKEAITEMNRLRRKR